MRHQAVTTTAEIACAKAAAMAGRRGAKVGTGADRGQESEGLGDGWEGDDHVAGVGNMVCVGQRQAIAGMGLLGLGASRQPGRQHGMEFGGHSVSVPDPRADPPPDGEIDAANDGGHADDENEPGNGDPFLVPDTPPDGEMLTT